MSPNIGVFIVTQDGKSFKNRPRVTQIMIEVTITEFTSKKMS